MVQLKRFTGRFLRNVLVILLASLLHACMAAPYKEPELGPRALMRFVSPSTLDVGNVLVYKLDPVECRREPTAIGVLSGMAVRHNRKKLGMPLGEVFPQ